MEVKMNISIMDLLPKSVAMGTAMMLSQREKGMEKYGQPIEDANLSALELVEHAAQEAADGLVYISELPAKVQALLDRIAELHDKLIEANNTTLAAQAHLIAIRAAARVALEYPADSVHASRLHDMVFVTTKDLPPSKHEQALREIKTQCQTITLGSPGEQLGEIHDIVREALK